MGKSAQAEGSEAAACAHLVLPCAPASKSVQISYCLSHFAQPVIIYAAHKNSGSGGQMGVLPGLSVMLFACSSKVLLTTLHSSACPLGLC